MVKVKSLEEALTIKHNEVSSHVNLNMTLT